MPPNTSLQRTRRQSLRSFLLAAELDIVRRQTMKISAATPARLPFLSLSGRHWVVLAGALVLLFIVLDLTSRSNPIRVWYYMRVVAPTQEGRYGFTAELGADPSCVEITSVAQGGAFFNAGIQKGFVPREQTCLGISQAELFLTKLKETASGTVRLRFSVGGCAAYSGSEARIVTVSVPPAPAG